MTRRYPFLMAAMLMLAPASRALADATYTFETIRSPGAHLIWPNEANGRSRFDSEGGLLGRVVTAGTGTTPVLDPGVANTCELAPSYPCAAGSPPFFLLPPGSAEGPAGAGGGTECNRIVAACNTVSVPLPGHGGHLNASEGSYSFLHTAAVTTDFSPGHSLAFIDAEYTYTQSLYGCNGCAPTGRGRDLSTPASFDNTIPQATITPTGVSAWLTQAIPPYGHAQVSLQAGESTAGSTSICGNGVLFWAPTVDLCVDGLQPGEGNFTNADQKMVFRTYSVSMAGHASAEAPSLCNPPDCYVENVIIPAALAQNAGTLNVQVMSGTNVMLADLPGLLPAMTIDTLVYALTTQAIDVDGDGMEDRIDPCPNDATNFCLNDLLGGGLCPAGRVFCMDASGAAGCFAAVLCDTRRDINQDCSVDTSDANAIFGTAFFNSGLPAGPFDP